MSGLNFRYIGDNKAVVTLFHHEKLVGANFDDPTPPREVVCQVEWCEDLVELWNPELWVHYVVDLETRTAKEITGYETHSPGHGNYRLYYQIDGRTYFWVEGGAEGEFGLTMYELDLDTATVSNAGRYVWAPESEAHFSTVGRVR